MSLNDAFHKVYPCIVDGIPFCKSVLSVTKVCECDCDKVVILIDGAIRDVPLDSTVADLNSINTSVNYNFQGTEVPDAYNTVKSDIAKINKEIAKVKEEIPLYFKVSPDAAKKQSLNDFINSDHFQNSVNDSYLLRKVAEVKSVYAAEAAKQVASAASKTSAL
jgi:hypothetical protein